MKGDSVVGRSQQEQTWGSPSSTDSRAVSEPGSPRSLNHLKKLAQLIIMAPVLLLAVTITADAGRLFYGYLQMSSAVRAGATLAAQSPANTEEINREVLGHSSKLSDLTTLAITCSAGSCGEARSGDTVTLKAIWNFEPVTWKIVDPIWSANPIVLSTQVTMKVL